MATQEDHAGDQHAGACLCGAIRFRIAGRPIGGNICYCTQCRRQTGSPMAAFATFRLDQLELLAGQPASYRASEIATRQFCARCGSALFWRADGREELDVFLGALDEPERLRKPAMQIWTQHRLPWVPAMAEIKAYKQSRKAG